MKSIGENPAATNPPGAARRASILCAAAMLVGAAGPTFAAPTDAFYQNSLMSIADRRCKFFEPRIAAVLAAARLEARGAALKAGVTLLELDRVEARARAKAYSQPCNSRDFTVAAANVRKAFEGLSQYRTMRYPGDIAGWNVERINGRRLMSWGVSQRAGFGADSMTFGLAGRNDQVALTAVAVFADGAKPVSARLLMRDLSKIQQPILDARAGAGARMPLSARVAPVNVSRIFPGVGPQPTDEHLATGAARSNVTFRFPAEAAGAMANLDPREAVVVEFNFLGRGGYVTRRAYVEVGSFAAARAFLGVGQR